MECKVVSLVIRSTSISFWIIQLKTRDRPGSMVECDVADVNYDFVVCDIRMILVSDNRIFRETAEN